MARLTGKRLQEYLDLHERADALRREATELTKSAAKIELEVSAHVAEHGGKDRLVQYAGYLLQIKAKPGSVSWKNAFVEAAGNDAAEKLKAAAPLVDEVVVEKLR
jgi:ribosomal protein L19